MVVGAAVSRKRAFYVATETHNPAQVEKENRKEKCTIVYLQCNAICNMHTFSIIK